MVRNKTKGYFWDSIGAIVSPCVYVVETCPSDGNKISFACPGQFHFSFCLLKVLASQKLHAEKRNVASTN
jgi:hypothetical protein